MPLCSSVGRLSITRGMFPCVRPGNKYLILKHGEPRIARGPECLAVQGIGVDEANATALLEEDDKLLRTLAGNAFTANICSMPYKKEKGEHLLEKKRRAHQGPVAPSTGS